MAPTRYHRKVIRICAEDSPNVRYGLAEKGKGEPTTDTMLLPGVLPYSDYVVRRATWDAISQCTSLDAMFYEGAEVRMYPPLWLAVCKLRALELAGKFRLGRAIGVDPAEGGDNTSMSVVDELGLIERRSRKTPDTDVISGEVLAFMREYGVPPERVAFDRGGGGTQIAHRLRAQGYAVTTVGFGEAVTVELRRGIRLLEEKKAHQEEHYVYKNRRAQMYGELRLAVKGGYAIGDEEIIRQLTPIPLLYDQEGRMRMLPKRKKDAESTEKTLTELLGCSPDETDSLVLAHHRLLHKQQARAAGAPKRRRR